MRPCGMRIFQFEVTYTEYLRNENTYGDFAGWEVRPKTHKTIRILADEFQQELAQAWLISRFKYYTDGGQGINLEILSCEPSWSFTANGQRNQNCRRDDRTWHYRFDSGKCVCVLAILDPCWWPVRRIRLCSMQDR